MLVTILLGFLAFFLTFAETAVATWEGQADRQDKAGKAANWASVFEALLLVDVVLTVHDPWIYSPIIIAAAWIGKYWSVVRRRRRGGAAASSEVQVEAQPRAQ